MPFTQADVDTLKQAIVDRKGASAITFSDGQSVTFDSIDAMLKLLSVMTAEAATIAGQVTRTRYAATSKDC